MAAYIDIYKDSKYCGFTDIAQVDSYLDEYERNASDMLRYLDWDEVVLYAVYSYTDEQDLISADFMLLRLSYQRYIELAAKLSKNCRLFFKSNLN